MRKLGNEEIIEKFIEIHGDKYNYSHVLYKNMKNKVIIVCLEHGEFEQSVPHHLKGSGCRKCANQIINLNNGKQFSQEKFIEIAIAKEIPNLSFEKSVYKGKRENVIVTCSIHGDYTTKAEIILKGNGCKKCASEKLKIDRICTTEEFIEKAIEVHGTAYGYLKVDYKGSFNKVEIFCNKHQKYFNQNPSTHLKNSGCPLCNTSKGELKILNYLEIENIEYETQKTFEGLILRRKLKFDFYLEKYNICIEFDGEQHFKPLSNHWGGESGFVKRQITDQLKNSYCIQNDIPLLRIKYSDTDIEGTIRSFLNNIENK